jgi:methyltransferase (TIGR00027 family)
MKLAGDEASHNPMGEWILVPRTRFGDDFLKTKYFENGCRQLVLLGAGMDARAYRTDLPELDVYEVDQWTTFDVKEPLLWNDELTVKSRTVVATDFSKGDPTRWARDLESQGFDKTVPTVWLLEGLLMYLTIQEQEILLGEIGRLSAPRSAAFMDAITRNYVNAGIVVAGARFVGGSDDYLGLWKRLAGFGSGIVHDFSRGIRVDRARRALAVDRRQQLTPQMCRNRDLVLFVTVEK